MKLRRLSKIRYKVFFKALVKTPIDWNMKTEEKA